jgi:hypothetical protein
MPLLRHHLARFSAKNFTINSNHVSPLRKPSHGAKSGLGALFFLCSRAPPFTFTDHLGQVRSRTNLEGACLHTGMP